MSEFLQDYEIYSLRVEIYPNPIVLVRSHIGWRGERRIASKVVEISPYQTRFKTLRESQKRQYLVSVDLSYYKWYQSLTLGSMPARTLGPQEGWIVRSHIGWRGERSILYKGVEIYP